MCPYWLSTGSARTVPAFSTVSTDFRICSLVESSAGELTLGDALTPLRGRRYNRQACAPPARRDQPKESL